LPPWEKIISVQEGLLRYTDGALNDATRDFHIPDQVGAFKEVFRELISEAADLRVKITNLINQNGGRLEDISDELGQAFGVILDDLKAAFPPPDHAPGHQQRQEMTTSVLDKAEQAILDLASKHGMSEEHLHELQASLEKLKPIVMKLVVITGMY
jgi:hypothetical protein